MPHIAPRRALAAACLAALAFAAGAQTMYKWVDEKGTTHFSEHPPPDGKAAKIEPKVTPPSAPAAASRSGPEAWRAQETEFRKRQLERGQREQADARAAAERQERCSKARRQVVFYRSGIIYHEAESGERVYLTEAKRAEMLAKHGDLVKEYCD